MALYGALAWTAALLHLRFSLLTPEMRESIYLIWGCKSMILFVAAPRSEYSAFWEEIKQLLTECAVFIGTWEKVICIHIHREETLLTWCLYIPNEDRSYITYNTYLYSVIIMLFSKWKNKWIINIWKMRKEDWKFKVGTSTEILCQNIKIKTLTFDNLYHHCSFTACLLGVA